MKDRPFIPAWLDDACLSQAEFRLYCHLCRRANTKTGLAWPRASNIARDCKMSINTVWKTLRKLESKGFIRRVGKSFAGSNRYQVLVPLIGANQIPINADSNQRKSEPSISANGSCQSAQMDSREGSPLKVHHERFSNKESGNERLPFESEKFRHAWNKWLQYKLETNQKLSPSTIREQLTGMKEWGEDHSIATINHTIRQGYQGLVEAPGHKTKEPAPISTGGRTCTIEEA